MRFPMSLFIVLVACTAVSAQAPKILWSPTGAGTMGGGTQNPIPSWAQSATYQQIHSAADLQNLGVVNMKGFALRPAGTNSFTGRTWSLNLTLSQTSVNSENATMTFSNNLGSTNTVTVFGSGTGSSRQFTAFSFKNFTGNSNLDPAFVVPFTRTYVYIAQRGNLCWEWRHKDATSVAWMNYDATGEFQQSGAAGQSFGKSCGNSAAVAQVVADRTLRRNVLNTTLSGAPGNTNVLLAVGLQQQSVNVGWCTNVEVAPLLYFPGTTNGSGSWSRTQLLTIFDGLPKATFYAQYAYGDSSQVPAIGLTNGVSYTSGDLNGIHGVCRVWRATNNSTTNGEESATTATNITKSYGLIVGWQQ